MAHYIRTCLSVLFVLNSILAAKGLSLPQETSSSRACVIGGGFSGLATARHLQDYGVNFTVFEAAREVGGTWRFDPHVGTDEDGFPLFTSMYKNLRTNTPRQTMEFTGFPFPEGTPSYPAGPCYYKYLHSFVKHFDLMKNIKVRSHVRSVRWAGDKWNLTYTRTDTKENVTETCNFMVIATGQYNKPKKPKIDGMKTFKGNMIHSHDYKEPEPFRNRRVLLVGAGASGLDLAIHLVNITSKLVHSHHLVYNQPNFPETYVKKPDIKEFTSNGVIFQDDSFEEIDDVIFCTGYYYAHPFIDKSVEVTTSDKFVLPLYQQIVHIKHPTLAFVGISKKIINRVLDVQAEYTAALAAGTFKLPSRQQMAKVWLDHVYSLHAQDKKIVEVNVIGDLDQYSGNLTQEAGVTRMPPVLTAIRDFNADYRLQDLINYRDYDYNIIDDFNYQRWYNPRNELPCPLDL